MIIASRPSAATARAASPHITEVVGLEGDVIITQDLFVYEITGDDAVGRVLGRHRSTGITRPRFWDPRPLDSRSRA